MKIIIEINEDDFGSVKDGDDISFNECDTYWVKELITCQDCMWYRRLPEWDDAEEEGWVCDAFIDPPIRKPDDFCSRAKRRAKK